MSKMSWLRLFALLLELTTAATPEPYPTRHGIIIDAASTESRIVVYRWQASRDGATDPQLVVPESMGSHVSGTGTALSSLVATPERVGPALKPLIEYAANVLEDLKDFHHGIPLWLFATAGMRLLRADERERLLDAIRAYLSGTRFLFKPDMAQVITGEEEGVYGWISLNFKLGKLRPNQELTSQNTVGALHLGDAGTQIVFLPEKSIMSNIFPLQLGLTMVRLYSYSFLHFGQREALDRVVTSIISSGLQRVQSVSALYHPCYSMGYEFQPDFNYNSRSAFPMEVTMQGSSSYAECVELIQGIFFKAAPCLSPTCSFYGVYQPHPYESQFVAYSIFGRVAKALALPLQGRLEDLRTAAEYVCSLSLNQLNVIYVHVESEAERKSLCFDATYVYVLLTYGFNFKPESDQIHFRTLFDDGSPIDYTIGAMIYEINQDSWLVDRNWNVSQMPPPKNLVV